MKPCVWILTTLYSLKESTQNNKHFDKRVAYSVKNDNSSVGAFGYNTEIEQEVHHGTF